MKLVAASLTSLVYCIELLLLFGYVSPLPPVLPISSLFVKLAFSLCSYLCIYYFSVVAFDLMV